MGKWAIAILTGLLSLAPLQSVQAESVLEQVKQTGVLVAGTRQDAIPFSYVTADGEWVGYSIDIINLVKADLERELGRSVTLKLVDVEPSQQISSIRDGTVDINCGSTSYTNSRARRVDFSIGYFRTGTQFLVRRNDDLQGGMLRIGIIPDTTNAEIAQRYSRIATLVPVENRTAGLEALEDDRIDALASDGILLEGLRQTADQPDRFAIMPPVPLNPQVYACVMPKGDTDFQSLVNQSLIEFMEGVVSQSPADRSMFNRWFGETGVVPVDPQPIVNFFQESLITYQPQWDNP